MTRQTSKSHPQGSRVDARGVVHGYRSGLEDKNTINLTERGIGHDFEKAKIPYSKPVTFHKYTPDFILRYDRGQPWWPTEGDWWQNEKWIEEHFIVETKGRFMPDDRKKHLLIRSQHPKLDIRFVFSRSAGRISKTSKTTYAAWCEKNGFQYADKFIPEEWFNEQP